MIWIAMFSQSGSEIVEISKKLGRYPDYIFTNNKVKETWHPELRRHSAVIRQTHNKIIDEIHRTVDVFRLLRGEPLITLHGYLRIMPEMPYEMYNGHPGDIINYPELKGKDPQKKALKLGLKSTGCVIHKVTEEVDGGEIISYNQYDMKEDETLESLINNLRDMSVKMWVKFLEEKINAGK